MVQKKQIALTVIISAPLNLTLFCLEVIVENEFLKAIQSGCTIEPTSCGCGGRYAWLTPTGRGSHMMYGCICHNEPPEVNITTQDNKALKSDSATPSQCGWCEPWRKDEGICHVCGKIRPAA